jgi:hypothetical protein
MESVTIHTSFKNVAQNLGNHILYYEAASFITLLDGYYDLSSLNETLRRTGTLNYKFVLSDDGLSFKLWKFLSSAAWQSNDFVGAIDKTLATSTLSLLN